MTSDEALMLEFQGGSRAAFDELFARYHKPLYGFFGRRLSNPERAEDLTQETFLVVIRGASRYEPRALVRTYLYGIALKLLAAERRKVLRSSKLGQSAPEPETCGTPESVLWVRQAMVTDDLPVTTSSKVLALAVLGTGLTLAFENRQEVPFGHRLTESRSGGEQPVQGPDWLRAG